MSSIDHTLVVGASADPINVTLSAAGLQLLEQLPGSVAAGGLSDHRALLTTITVAMAASGRLVGTAIVIDAEDILQVIDHAGTSRLARAV